MTTASRNGSSPRQVHGDGSSPAPTPDYYDHIMQSMAEVNRFAFRRDYVTSGVFTKYEALFVQDLLDQCASSGDIACVTATERSLWESLRWDKNTQNRLLRSLATKGYISLERRRNNQRTIHINIRKIAIAIALARQQPNENEQNTAEAGVCTSPNRDYNKAPKPSTKQRTRRQYKQRTGGVQ